LPQEAAQCPLAPQICGMHCNRGGYLSIFSHNQIRSI